MVGCRAFLLDLIITVGAACSLCFCFHAQSEFNEKDTFYIFNHVDITIYYHNVENEAPDSRLVAAKMEPKRYFIYVERYSNMRSLYLPSIFLIKSQPVCPKQYQVATCPFTLQRFSFSFFVYWPLVDMFILDTSVKMYAYASSRAWCSETEVHT